MLYLMVFVNCLDIICSFTANFTIVKGLLRWEEGTKLKFCINLFSWKAFTFLFFERRLVSFSDILFGTFTLFGFELQSLCHVMLNARKHLGSER